MITSKRLLGLVLLLVLAAVWWFDLGRHLTLPALQAHQTALQAWQAQHPLALALAYLGVYVLSTALSIPGATLLTLLGGALFGLWSGTLLVSLASTLGATLAMLVSRHLLRDAVEARHGRRLQALQQGLAREGAFYLFTLRLVPIVPFFVLNLLMGLTRIKTWTYAWVSQLGMLPATLVYVNAGTQLGQLQSLSGILSPALWGSFALLAVFPWAVRGLLSAWRRRQVYAPWRAQRPRRFDRNLIVIGAGAGGLVTAYIAAAVRAKVTLVEAHQMGGDCLNTGCVPSKALLRSAHALHQVRHAAAYGVQTQPPQVDFAAVMQRVRQVVQAIAPHDSVERYTGLGVEVLPGHATLLDPWTVAVRAADGQVQHLTARSIVLATGARPYLPPIPGLDAVNCLTSETLWDHLAQLPAPPARLLVLGGGPIGCELAQAMARLGSHVTLVEQAPRLLAREDAPVSQAVQAALQADGVRVMTAAEAVQVGSEAGQNCLWVVQDGQRLAVPFDDLLCAVGRVARLQGYGLETLGISTSRVIDTNDYLETLYPNIYAVGDAAGPYQFTHFAAHQAWYAAVNALFGHWRRFKVDTRVVPRVTFTQPEVARVGLNQSEARAQGVAFECTTFALDDLDRALADGEAHGYVEVLTEPGRDRLLGVTIVGSHAGDMLPEFVLAMRHGLGLNPLLSTMHAYPTWAEGNKYVAGAWKKAHAPERLLRWVARYHAWRRG